MQCPWWVGELSHFILFFYQNFLVLNTKIQKKIYWNIRRLRVKLRRRTHCWTDRFDLSELVSANSVNGKYFFLAENLAAQNGVRILTLLNMSRTIRLLRLIRFCLSFSSLDTISGSRLYRFRVCCFKAFVVKMRLPAAMKKKGCQVRAYKTQASTKNELLPICGG